MQLDQLGKVRIAGMCLSGCEVQWLILMVDVKKTGIYKIPLRFAACSILHPRHHWNPGQDQPYTRYNYPDPVKFKGHESITGHRLKFRICVCAKQWLRVQKVYSSSLQSLQLSTLQGKHLCSTSPNPLQP